MGRHVDMRQPEVTGHRGADTVDVGSAAAPVPERVGCTYAWNRYGNVKKAGCLIEQVLGRIRCINKSFVLNDQRNLVGW